MRYSYLSVIAIFAIMVISSTGIANAELSYEKQVKFVTAIEEVNGHILAARENIKLGNHEFASLHFTHPILELYDDLYTELINNSQIDDKVEFSLYVLKNTNPNVGLDFFDMQTDKIIKVLDEAKLALISEDTLNDPGFKLDVIIDLLDMSKMEYQMAVESNNEALKIIEYQDSQSFLLNAENMLYTINGMDQDKKNEIIVKLQLAQLSILDHQPLNDIETQFDYIIDEIGMIDRSELVFQEIIINKESGLLEKQNNSHDFIILEQSVVPSWIKMNASWWSDGIISDIEFLSGIEYLLDENIIEVPIISVSYESENNDNIPSWIKNNASWWSDGIVSDVEFLSSIEYMIEHGILTV